MEVTIIITGEITSKIPMILLYTQSGNEYKQHLDILPSVDTKVEAKIHKLFRLWK